MSSGFITESEALEARRQRQEEWEKVRTEDQPEEAPEEPYDNRTLFQRLEEQRLKKEAEYEESHKLKNMIRGLDDEEVSFLDLVEESKARAANRVSQEERREIQEFRERVSTVGETEQMQRLRAQLTPAPAAPRPAAPRRSALPGVIVRKRKAGEADDKDSPAEKKSGVDEKNEDSGEGSSLKCIAVLPGLGHYGSDTSSESDSSDSDINEMCPQRDLCGRKPDSEKKKDQQS